MLTPLIIFWSLIAIFHFGNKFDVANHELAFAALYLFYPVYELFSLIGSTKLVTKAHSIRLQLTYRGSLVIGLIFLSSPIMNDLERRNLIILLLAVTLLLLESIIQIQEIYGFHDPIDIIRIGHFNTTQIYYLIFLSLVMAKLWNSADYTSLPIYLVVLSVLILIVLRKFVNEENLNKSLLLFGSLLIFEEIFVFDYDFQSIRLMLIGIAWISQFRSVYLSWLPERPITVSPEPAFVYFERSQKIIINHIIMGKLTLSLYWLGVFIVDYKNRVPGENNQFTFEIFGAFALVLLIVDYLPILVKNDYLQTLSNNRYLLFYILALSLCGYKP